MKFLFTSITRLALRFRVITIALVVLMMTLGAISWTRLNQELLPPVDLPQTIILAQTSGLTSEQVLTIITQPLEEELDQIEDIINIESETTGSFGTFITAFNDFGINQEPLREEIRIAINSVWLPLRYINAEGEGDAAAMVAELDPAVLIYLASQDSNFLFQLAPEVWSELPDETVELLLAYLAQTEEAATTAVNALQRLVDKEIVPQLDALDDVASIDVVGGETIPENISGEAVDAEEAPTTGEPLLIRISPDIWELVSPRISGVDALDDTSLSYLQGINVSVPGQPPALPESWQFAGDNQDAPTFFFDASDLVEVATLTRPTAVALNEFLEAGELTAAIQNTNDLTVELVETMLALDPTMAAYFESDQLLAMPQDVFDLITVSDDFVQTLDGFTRDDIAARKMSQSIAAGNDVVETERIPVELPGQWQIQPPQLITFSFSDIPLASFSVAATGEFGAVEETDIAANDVDDQEQVDSDEAGEAETSEQADSETAGTPEPEDVPLPGLFAAVGQGFGAELANTSDLLTLSFPEELAEPFGLSTSPSAAELLNFLAAPPELDNPPDGYSDVQAFGATLINQLTPENIAYLVAADPEFADNLVDEVVAALSGDAQTALIGDFVASGNATADTVEAPALNPEWTSLSETLASFLGVEVELDTADDLLVLPIPLADIIEGFIAQPGAEQQLAPLLGNLTTDAAAYVLEEQASILTDLPPYVLVFLNGDVIALFEEDVQATIPASIMPSDWNTLLIETTDLDRGFFTTSDFLALDDSNEASTILNSIDGTDLSEELSSYTVRLMNSLTPEIVESFVENEPEFFNHLDSGVILKLAPDVLALLESDEINDLESLTADEAEQVIAIRDGDAESAFAALETIYATDLPPADPSAPDLNGQWAFIAPNYGIELDTADDFYRFPEGFAYESTSALINSVFDSPQGANFAPDLLGNMPLDAIEYMLDRDEATFDNLISPALALLPSDGLALLSDELQARAEEAASEFTPEGQITRTNGNDSLFLVVFKEPEANTVTTFADVEELLLAIDEEDENIDVGIVFEQSSFVEQSIEGVAREGMLGAIFAIIIILVFLSGGSWGLRGRRMVGGIMIAVFTGLIFLLTVTNLGDANNLGEAFAQADVVIRVLLIFGVLAGVFVMLWPGNVPYPSWRATLVIAVSIPLSIMIALAGMYFFAPAMNNLIAPLAENGGLFEILGRLFPESLTLNIMTLSGLTVAVGRVVDDSIVVLENIFRQLQAGGDKKEAIVQGTRDVSAAIFTATLIAVVVFLPLGLTGGLIGSFFLPFGLAVTYALAGSFIVAITVIPVMAYLFIDIEDMPEDGDIWVAAYYLPVLKWGLRNFFTKATVIVLALVSMAFAGYLFSQRPFAFLPNFGEPQISVVVNMPVGTTIIETNERVEELETWITENVPEEQVTAIQTYVGSVGANFDALLGGSSVSENQANITIGLDVTTTELEQVAEDLEIEAKYIFNFCPQSQASANTAQRDLMTTGEVEGALDVVCADGTEIDNNVEVSAVSVADGGFGGFALVVSGPIDAAVNQEIIDAINGIEGLARAESNFLADASGSDNDNATFIRVQRTEAFSYTAEVDTDNTIGVTQEAILAIEGLESLEGRLCEADVEDTSNCFTVSQGFESEIQTEGFQGLLVAMVLAIGIVIIILASTMQSFVYWLAIIFSIFVAPVGAAIALTLTDRVLGISALIGLLMLIGLVIANAVVLIDRVRSNRRERGMNLYDALVEAGGRRLRPILMTSLATIIALTPLAIGLSEGAIIASELGTAVIGGSISSTLLTLIVVPVVFSLLSPLHRLLSFRKDTETSDPSPQAAD